MAGETIAGMNQGKPINVKSFCTECGTPLQGKQRFCHMCGKAIKRHNKGSKIKVTKFFCSDCENEMRKHEDSCPECFYGSPEIRKVLIPKSALQRHIQMQEEADSSSPDISTQDINVPVLRTWKTSVEFSIIGFITPIIVLTLLAIPFSSPYQVLVSLILSIIMFTLSIIYAAIIYPSYFTKAPFVTSSEAISFLNLFFGSLLFGSLWNSNLTKRRKGVSHIVYAMVNCIFIVLYILPSLRFLAYM